jgi:hypothetical protein
MNFKTYHSPKRFGIFVDTYDLQGDEEFLIVITLFNRAFRFLFMPNHKLIGHFTICFPPIRFSTINGVVKSYKTNIFTWARN